MEARLTALLEQARSLGMPEDALFLLVDAGTQELFFFDAGHEPEAIWPVSTSRLGLGCEDESGKTPTGFHEVTEWIGHGAEPGTVFESRVPNGEVLSPAEWNQEGGKDRILSRILRLSGREPGLNAGTGVDSFVRYIYIHGTNQEQHLGQEASCGCIRMGNLSLIDLFERTTGRKTWCWIGNLLES